MASDLQALEQELADLRSALEQELARSHRLLLMVRRRDDVLRKVRTLMSGLDLSTI